MFKNSNIYNKCVAHKSFYRPAVLCIFESQNIFSKTERKKLQNVLISLKSFLGSEFSSYPAGLFLPVSAYVNEAKCKQ